MYRLQKINNEKVDPIPTQSYEPHKVKGYNLIPELYCNIFICARKKSGKTNTLFKILKECADKETKIYIFSSTAYNDKNMIFIKDYFDRKKYQCEVFTEIIDNKENNLDKILKELENKNDEKDDSEPEPIKYISVDEPKKHKKKKRKPKKMAPEIIFVFDDISSELKMPQVNKLVKQHRHYKSKVIISSQEVIDLMPEARKQIDFWLLFGGHPETRLDMIYKSASLPISFEQFLKLYVHATKKKYNFLYIDTIHCQYRKNFNEMYV